MRSSREPERSSDNITALARPVGSGNLFYSPTTTPVPLPTTNSTISPPILSEEAKIGIEVSPPMIVISVIGLTVLYYLRNRKRNRSPQTIREEESGSSEEIQPYLDNKGELETEGLGKYELDGEEKISELSEESEICEMPTEQSDAESTSLRPELKAGKHLRL